MIKTKDEILMVALGVKQFTILPTFFKEQIYWAMDEWATLTKTAQLQQPVVVRGGVIEAQSVQLTEEDLKWVNSCVTQITPTEPLPAEGVAKSVCADKGRVKDGVCKYPIGTCEDCKYGL